MFNYCYVDEFMNGGEVASTRAWAEAVKEGTDSGYSYDLAKDANKAQDVRYYAIAAEALKANPLAMLTVVESGEEGQEKTVMVVAQCLPDGVIRLHEVNSVLTNPGFMTEAHYEMANDSNEEW